MVEPSYLPLDSLQSPRESLSVSPLSPPEPKYEDVPDQPESGNAAEYQGLRQHEGSRSSTHSTPLRPQLFHRGPPNDSRPPIWPVVRAPLKMALLPLAAIGYLAFCYAVHGMVIPVKTYGLYAVTPQHLAIIKGGITSISIIIISIALYPIYDVISCMKSEEFFRVLASHSHGVPLDTINHISTPTFGNVDAILAIWRQGCSNYYILATVAFLLAWVVATLAPGALTVGNVLADGGMVALAIGGVPPQSVVNGSSRELPAWNAALNSDKASSIAWAEIELDMQYSFGVVDTSDPDYVAYITPFPLDLDATTNARWLTDVIGINPKCSWASTNLTQPLRLPFNSTRTSEGYMGAVHLVDFDLDVQLSSLIPPLGSSAAASVQDPTLYVTNHTTNAFPVDGSTVFLIGQCTTGCLAGSSVQVNINMGGLPTFTLVLTDQTWTATALVCRPNITIETREVRNEGLGWLSIQPRPVGRQMTPQRNLHPVQTAALFSIATKSLSQSAGPKTGNMVEYSALGMQVQTDLLFGKSQFDSLPGLDAPSGTKVTLNLASTEDITKGYTRIIQSASKSFLSSYLGTSYVPGRISTTEIVFTASMPNVAASTAIFALLAALLIIAHFRPGKGTEFTLVNVVAAVHRSELPAQFAQMKAEQAAIVRRGKGHARGDSAGEVDAESRKVKGRRFGGGGGGGGGEACDITEMLGERRIFMQQRDGSAVLHIS